MDNGRKEHVFLWSLENYSYCWRKNGDGISSPKFTAHELEATVWYLELFPRGRRNEDKGYISMYLNRCEDNTNPKNISLKYELSILAADSSPLCSAEFEYTFTKGVGYGRPRLVQMDKVLSLRVIDLPQDTLTVCCKMWMGEGDIHKVGQTSARTRIGIEKISFLHAVKNFTELEPNKKETVQIRSPSKKECDISSNLYLSDGSCCEGKIIVETVSSDKNHVLFKQKLSLIDGTGNIIECGEVDNRFDATRKDIQKLPLSLARQLILKKKILYLPNDELSVLCECAFSTGVDLEKIEEIKHGLPLVALNQSCKSERNKDGYNAAEKLSASTSASEDMTAVYLNQCLTDVEMKTKTKSFSAHKIVLCARSSVFKSMLTSDMKEKNTDCIQVDDLENDTVEQMLLFLYSDHLENLQWESAVQLYYAGDKYAIDKLKLLCSSFLVDNLSTSTASELLLLADTHNDSDLKKIVEDFILEHEDEIFGSDEWEKLIETNPQLVIKTMHLKYKRKKGGK